MRKASLGKRRPIAILVSDIHLSHHAPRYRRAEPDWYEAMARHLRSLQKWQTKYQVPVICAGDVFHRWNSPPKLINFAIEMMPKHFVSIPGQHDLPNHRLEAVKDSAYWTLMQSIRERYTSFFELYRFPWGTNARVAEAPKRGTFPNIALLHRYVCDKKNAYPGAPADSFVENLQEEFREFDLVISGDHHKHFKGPESAEGPKIINVGQFLCRNRGESKHPNALLLDSYLNITHLRDYKTEALDVFNDEDEDESPSDRESGKSLELEGMLAAIDSLSMVSRDLQGVIDMIAKTSNRSRVSIDLIRSILSERE